LAFFQELTMKKDIWRTTVLSAFLVLTVSILALQNSSLSSKQKNLPVVDTNFEVNGPISQLLQASNPQEVFVCSLKFVQLWDLASKSIEKTFASPNQIRTTTLSPDGRWLVWVQQSEDDPNKSTLVSVDTVSEQKTTIEYEALVNSLCFAASGKSLILGFQDGSVKVRDWTTRQETKIISAGSNGVSVLQVSPDGLLLAVGGQSKRVGSPAERFEPCDVRLYSLRDNTLLCTLEGHQDKIATMSFSPDGSTLATCDTYQGAIRVWEVKTGALKETLKGHRYPVRSLAFSPDSLLLASGSSDNTIRLWDLSPVANNQSRETTSVFGHNEAVTSLLFTADGQLLSAGQDRMVKIWKLKKGK
jgi:WD40 repeat protein